MKHMTKSNESRQTNNPENQEESGREKYDTDFGKRILLIVIGVFILGLVIPGFWQNASDYDRIKNEINETHDLVDKICDSGCRDYPDGWIQPGYELEAENYCLLQCQKREEMKNIMTGAVLEEFNYRSAYHKTIGVISCLLGLRCLPT